MEAMTTRGQGFTLEAVLAAMVLLLTVTAAFHLVGVTPNTPSTADASDEQAQRAIADGVLDASVADGSLHQLLRYWDDDAEGFHNATDGYYAAQPPPTTIGERFDRVFTGDGSKYNLNAVVATDAGLEVQRIVHHGTPTDQAIRSVTTVTLLADDLLLTANGTPGNTTIAEADTFYATGAMEGGYAAVVRVELEVWRT